MRLSPSILTTTLLISTITQQQYILLENWEKTKNCFGFQHWFLITLFGTWHGFGWWRLILFWKKGHIFVSVFLRIIFKTWLLIDEQNDDIEMYAFFTYSCFEIDSVVVQHEQQCLHDRCAVIRVQIDGFYFCFRKEHREKLEKKDKTINREILLIYRRKTDVSMQWKFLVFHTGQPI